MKITKTFFKKEIEITPCEYKEIVDFDVKMNTKDPVSFYIKDIIKAISYKIR